jgi:iron complex transport system permease protein
VLTLVLAGVAISSFAAALSALALNLAPSPYAALEIVSWLLGSLADRSMDHVILTLPVMAVGWVLLLSSGTALNALSLGDDTARSLGISLNKAKLQVIVGTALAVGAAVSVTGGISFVGLVVPHLLRPLVGHEPKPLLLASALGGASLLLAADIVVRLAPGPIELKLGVVTALLGAPFFLHLIYRMRRDGSL